MIYFVKSPKSNFKHNNQIQKQILVDFELAKVNQMLYQTIKCLYNQESEYVVLFIKLQVF